MPRLTPAELIAEVRLAGRAGLGEDPGRGSYVGAHREVAVDNALVLLADRLAEDPDPAETLRAMLAALQDELGAVAYRSPLLAVQRDALDALDALPGMYGNVTIRRASAINVLLGLVGDERIKDAFEGCIDRDVIL